MKYGLPYKGSKNKLAERIVHLLPKRTHLVDLFCGGCAVSHAALLMRKYKHIHINDINWMCPTLFIDSLNGKYNDESRWISREDFSRLKDTDPYVAVVWSFGNNMRNYLYSREIEPLKKAIHYAIFFSDYSLGKELGYDLSFIDHIPDLQKRYIAVKHYFSKHVNIHQVSFDDAGGGRKSGHSRNHSTGPHDSHQCKYGAILRLQTAEAMVRLNTNLQNWWGKNDLIPIGINGTFKRHSELQHLECINRESQSPKKNRSEELCNCERQNTVASLAIPRTAAQSAQIFGGGKSCPSHPLCLTTSRSAYPKTA